MIKTLKINILSLGIIIISLLFIPSKGVSQVTNSTVDSLVNAGFENVCSTETDTERIYVIQNSAYKLQGVGIGKALDIIMLSGMPVNKQWRGKRCFPVRAGRRSRLRLREARGFAGIAA